MEKTCNLSTVCNTSHEVRKSTSCVDYYYIDFCNLDVVPAAIANVSLSRVMNVIYDYLNERDIYYIETIYVCAKMIDGSIRRVFVITIDSVDRHMRISRI